MRLKTIFQIKNDLAFQKCLIIWTMFIETLPHFKIVPMLPKKEICYPVDNIIPETHYL